MPSHSQLHFYDVQPFIGEVRALHAGVFGASVALSIAHPPEDTESTADYPYRNLQDGLKRLFLGGNRLLQSSLL